MRKHLLFSFALLLSTSPAFAFHVPEHVQITRRAVEGLQRCGLLPIAWDGGWTDAVVKADQDEDYDLVRKWTKYSHYYNPNHPLDQARADSSLSVRESVEAITANPGDVEQVNQLIGRIIHHVQDSSVPGHAIPVAHADHDGFEVYDISPFYREAGTLTECAGLSPAEPLDVLRDNALATLAALGKPVQFTREGFVKSQPWLGTFWLLGEGNSFGAYGPLEDNFGLKTFALEDGRTVVVDPQQYAAFKRDRAAAAVRATQAVILWANRIRGF